MSEHDYWIHRLSDVLDGSLDPDEERAAQAHLAGCTECRETVTELRRLVAEARTLGEISPSRDLWPGIEAALARPDPDVIALRSGVAVRRDTASGGLGGRRQGVLLSVPQLAAAAAVLVLVSSLLTVWARPDAPEAVTTADPSVGAVRPASADGAPPELARELGALTRAMDEARNGLDPNTLRIIEKNLAVIERAIDESRRALALDPANAFLREHLDRAWERKMSYLREAAGIADWSTS